MQVPSEDSVRSTRVQGVIAEAHPRYAELESSVIAVTDPWHRGTPSRMSEVFHCRTTLDSSPACFHVLAALYCRADDKFLENALFPE